MEEIKMGRPRLFEPDEIPELKEKVDHWLRSCRYTVHMTDESGEPVLDENGEAVMKTVWVRRPTEGTLVMEALGVLPNQWVRYSDHEKYPEFTEITEYIHNVCKEFLMLDGMDAKQSNMHRFILENCYGMRQKTELEIGKETRDQASATALSLSEKLSAIKEAIK